MIGGNGVYCLAQLYDDGTSTQSQLILNITGACDIYQLSFPKLHGKSRRYVAIIFMNEMTWVVCDKEKGNWNKSVQMVLGGWDSV